MPKIAMIGAGSVIFTKTLMNDIMAMPDLHARCSYNHRRLRRMDAGKLVAIVGAVFLLNAAGHGDVANVKTTLTFDGKPIPGIILTIDGRRYVSVSDLAKGLGMRVVIGVGTIAVDPVASQDTVVHDGAMQKNPVLPSVTNVPKVEPATGKAATSEPQPSASLREIRPGQRLEDTTDFFTKYMQVSRLLRGKRDDFEIEEDFLMRQAGYRGRFDLGKVYYFEVKPSLSDRIKPYNYDIDSKLLTVFAGGCPFEDKLEFKGQKPKPGERLRVTILSISEDEGTYKASNAYGAETTVEKARITDYQLGLINASDFPEPVYDFSEMRFAVTTQLEPAVAKDLSESVQVIVGVKLVGYQNVGDDFDSTKPTFDNPRETIFVSYAIDAQLAELMLRDSKTGKIYENTLISPKPAEEEIKWVR